MLNEGFQYSRYVERMRLTAQDLENQRSYDSGKRQLLNRVLYGKGVFAGLVTTVERDGVLIAPGLAVDAWGRELYLPQERFLRTTELFAEMPASCAGWRLCIRYAERACGEGVVLGADGGQTTEPNRIAEEVQFVAAQSPDSDGVTLAGLEPWVDDCGTLRLAVRFEPDRPEGPVMAERRGKTATGFVRLTPGDAEGRVWYSPEISHGLGAGAVWVGLSVEGMPDGRRCSVSGEGGLFGYDLHTSVQLFPDSGTFVAAARAARPYQSRIIVLRWWAMCCQQGETFPMESLCFDEQQRPDPTSPIDSDSAATEQGTAAFRLEPQIALLNPGERMTFTLFDRDVPITGARKFWAQAGEIDDTGAYVAPQSEGCYTIHAADMRAPEHPVSALAMVSRRQ